MSVSPEVQRRAALHAPVPEDEQRIVVRCSGPLAGEVVVPGAKNSVLKLMATTILCDGEFTLGNVPGIADVTIMGELLAAIGVTMDWAGPDALRLVNTGRITPVAPYELVERIRASINVLGPLLARCGEVRLSMPGGDDFGARPIDMHVAGLEKMGASSGSSTAISRRAPNVCTVPTSRSSSPAWAQRRT
ncbi:MAG: hypothetical protein AAFP84_04220 [Actinomycetota bacterium]